MALRRRGGLSTATRRERVVSERDADAAAAPSPLSLIDGLLDSTGVRRNRDVLARSCSALFASHATTRIVST